MHLIATLFTAFNILACAECGGNSLIKEEAAIQENSCHVFCIKAHEIQDNTTLITLSNGTMWRYDDIDLFDSNGWHLGDRVGIVYTYFDGYHLENQSYQGCVPVQLANSEYPEIQAARITYINPKHDTFLLDDGTVWHVGWWSAIWTQPSKHRRGWQIGDRIVAAPHAFCVGDADHLLVNLDVTMPEQEELPSNVRARLDSAPYQIPSDPMQREKTVWPIHVVSVTPQEYDQLVLLDNGTSWLCEKSAVLNSGDEVIFDDVDEESDTKKTIDLETSEFVAADTAQEKWITIASVSKEGQKLVLSDGSIWLIHRAKHWKVGDRILVSALGTMPIDTSTHVLVNIDNKDKENKVVTRNAALVR